MSVIVDPKLGINVYAPFQSNQWEDSKKARRWLSFFASRVVMDTSCTALPASPAEGDAVLMSSSYPIHASDIARYSTELMAWEYMAPWAGLTVCDTSGNEWYFSGSVWVQNPSADISALATTVSTHTAQIAALQAGGTGGGGSLPSWLATHPDAPPAVPGVYDDEFTADSSAWSWVNQGGGSYEIISSRLHLLAPADASSDNLRARVRSVSGSWDIRAKISVQPKSAVNFAQGGLILRNSTSGKIVSLTIAYDASPNRWSVDFNAWNSVTSFNAQLAASGNIPQMLYLRLKNDGSSISAYYSLAGDIWTLLGGQLLSAFISSVDQIGIYGSSSKSNQPVDVVCDWIRSS